MLLGALGRIFKCDFWKQIWQLEIFSRIVKNLDLKNKWNIFRVSYKQNIYYHATFGTPAWWKEFIKKAP